MIKKSTLLNVLLLLIYKILLDICLVKVVYPVYKYTVELSVTTDGPISYYKIIISYFFVVLSFLFLNLIKKRHKGSRFVLLIQLLLIVVPFSTLYGYLNYPSWQYSLILLGFWSTVFFVLYLPLIRLPNLRNWTKFLIFIIFAAIVVYVYVGIIATGGLSRINFNLYEVYKYRSELIKNYFPLAGYFIPWTAKIINITLLVYFISVYRKSRIKSLLGIAFTVVMQLFLFSMTNFKGYLFLPFVVMGLMFLLSKVDVIRATLLGLPISIITLLLIYFIGLNYSAAILNRVFFTPSAMHSLYFGYFSSHPLGLLVGSVGSLFGSTYHESIVLVIAKRFWGYVFDPNVGWIADAYSNFGVLGICAYSFILAIALRFVDGFSRYFQNGAIEGVLLGFSLGLVNSALLTEFLTGGFVIAVIAFWLIRSDSQINAIDLRCEKLGQM